jgi:hypothetical protein
MCTVDEFRQGAMDSYAYLVFLLNQDAEDGKNILTLPVISMSSEPTPKRAAAEWPHLASSMTRDQVKVNLDRLNILDARLKAQIKSKAGRGSRRPS